MKNKVAILGALMLSASQSFAAQFNHMITPTRVPPAPVGFVGNRHRGGGFSCGIKGMASSNFTRFGADIAANAAKARATPARLARHKQYLNDQRFKRENPRPIRLAA